MGGILQQVGGYVCVGKSNEITGLAFICKCPIYERRESKVSTSQNFSIARKEKAHEILLLCKFRKETDKTEAGLPTWCSRSSLARISHYPRRKKEKKITSTTALLENEKLSKEALRPSPSVHSTFTAGLPCCMS